MKDVLGLLRTQQALERAFVEEMTGQEDLPGAWSPAMTMFHIAKWRDRLWNALTEAAAGQPVNAPAGAIDELNDAEMVGAAGVTLAEAAASSDAALTSLIAMLETMGEQPIKWYAATTTAEAVIRNSYVHPRNHLADHLLARGETARSNAMLEETAAEMRRVEAPGHILGAALFNVAAIRAVQGRADEAFALLEEALPMRPDLTTALATEADFGPLRDSPRFRALFVPGS